MTVEELRIGNYLELNGNIGRVLEIYDNAIKLSNTNTNCAYFIEHFKPIELTEEILLKFGFEKNSLNIYKKGILIANEFEVFLGNIIIKIKHLHQLQNLYWCLVGEELCVKL